MRIAVGLLACAVLWPRHALAEPVIRWEAPPGCPSAEQAKAELARLLSRPIGDVAVERSAVVRIGRRPHAGFEATIEIPEGSLVRKRVLHDDDCAVLVRAALIVVSLAFDPAADVAKLQSASGAAAESDGSSSASPGQARESDGSTAAEPFAAPRPTPSATATGGRAPATAPAEASDDAASTTAEEANRPRTAGEPTSPAQLHAFLGGAVELGAGVIPRLAPSAALIAGAVTKRWRAAVRLTYAPPERATLEYPAGVGGRVGLLAAAVEAGPYARISRIELPVLLGFEAGAFEASGDHVSGAQTRNPLWLASYVGGGAVFVWTATVAVGLRLEAVIPLRRPRFVVQDDLGATYEFHRPAAVAGRGSLEVELHFR